MTPPLDPQVTQKITSFLVHSIQAIGTPYGLHVTVTLRQRGTTLLFDVAMVHSGFLPPVPKALLQDRESWTELARHFGIPQEWLGSRILVDGQPYRIIGLDEDDNDSPLICQNLRTGTLTRLSRDEVQGVSDDPDRRSPVDSRLDEDEEEEWDRDNASTTIRRTQTDQSLRAQVQDMQEYLKEGGYVRVLLADGSHVVPDAIRISPDGQRLQARVGRRPYQDVIDYTME
jgi:hypothetical protein